MGCWNCIIFIITLVVCKIHNVSLHLVTLKHTKKQHVAVNLPTGMNFGNPLEQHLPRKTEDDIIHESLLPDIEEIKTQQVYAKDQSTGLLDTTEERMFSVQPVGQEPDIKVRGTQQVVENFEKTWGAGEAMPSLTDRLENRFDQSNPPPPSPLSIHRFHKSRNSPVLLRHGSNMEKQGRFNDDEGFKDGFYPNHEKHHGHNELQDGYHDLLNDIPNQRLHNERLNQRAQNNRPEKQQAQGEENSSQHQFKKPNSQFHKQNVNLFNDVLNRAEQGIELPGELSLLKSGGVRQSDENGIPWKFEVIQAHKGSEHEEDRPLDTQFQNNNNQDSGAVPNLLMSMFDAPMPEENEQNPFTGGTEHAGYPMNTNGNYQSN